jgi:hypothetical protein
MAAIWAFTGCENLHAKSLVVPYNKCGGTICAWVHAFLYLCPLMVLTSTMPHHAYAALLTDAGSDWRLLPLIKALDFLPHTSFLRARCPTKDAVGEEPPPPSAGNAGVKWKFMSTFIIVNFR